MWQCDCSIVAAVSAYLVFLGFLLLRFALSFLSSPLTDHNRNHTFSSVFFFGWRFLADPFSSGSRLNRILFPLWFSFRRKKLCLVWLAESLPPLVRLGHPSPLLSIIYFLCFEMKCVGDHIKSNPLFCFPPFHSLKSFRFCRKDVTHGEKTFYYVTMNCFFMSLDVQRWNRTAARRCSPTSRSSFRPRTPPSWRGTLSVASAASWTTPPASWSVHCHFHNQCRYIWSPLHSNSVSETELWPVGHWRRKEMLSQNLSQDKFLRIFTFLHWFI